MTEETSLKPQFVVIVGIDGSGKTTLINRLSQQGVEAKTWRDLKHVPEAAHLAPDYPTQIRSTLSPLARALFVGGHLAAEYEFLIRPSLKAQKSIIFDSYYYKSFAKEMLYGVVHPLFFDICHALPKPDLVLYLDVDPMVAYRRRSQFSPYEYFKSSEESDVISFQGRLSHIIKEQISNVPNIFIDANRCSNDIEASVLMELERIHFFSSYSTADTDA